MKKILFMIIILAAGTISITAEEVRISTVFVHYSVGTTIVSKTNNPGSQHIRDTLNVPPVYVGTDTARIVFRSYRMNNDLGGNPLSDTVSNQDGWDNRFENYRYEYVDPWHNRMRIWNSDNGMQGNAYAGLLNDLFEIANKQDSAFWRAFTVHNVPGSSGDSVQEKYDLFMVKNPYACWACMTQAQADSQRTLFQIVADSMANHPEQNFALIFGTPLRLSEQGCGGDSSNARITYELVTWFADTFDVSGYENVWKYEFYRILCETSPDSANRYCLKEEYWDQWSGSHLGQDASDLAQDSLAAFIRRTVEDILVQRSGQVTRQDIDRKILEFREGSATVQDVLDLIDRYSGGD
jgi:hypothetical protein